MRVPVMPRDIQPGDKVDQMGPDLSVITAAVTEVEKIRRGKRTTYRVHLDGGHKPFVLNPGHPITVDRQ